MAELSAKVELKKQYYCIAEVWAIRAEIDCKIKVKRIKCW